MEKEAEINKHRSRGRESVCKREREREKHTADEWAVSQVAEGPATDDGVLTSSPSLASAASMAAIRRSCCFSCFLLLSCKEVQIEPRDRSKETAL